MKEKYKKGFTLVEMVISFGVMAVVTAATFAGLSGWYSRTNKIGYEDDAQGIIDAYHDWYGTNVASIGNESAEEALYDFVVSDSGVSFYNYDKTRFNYAFKTVEDSYKAYLLYQGNDYSCSIALDINRMSATNDLEKFHLSYTNDAYLTVSDTYEATLSNIDVEEYQTVLGTYNGKIGRKAIKMIVRHEQKDDFGNKIVDTLYARPGREIVTNELNKTVYDLGNSTQVACLKNKNGQSYENFNGYSFAINNSNTPSEYIENVNVDGYDESSNVVIYDTENWTYDDDFVNDSNLSKFGAIIKFKVIDTNYESGHTVRKTRTVTKRRSYNDNNIWGIHWVSVKSSFNQTVSSTDYKVANSNLNPIANSQVSSTYYNKIVTFDELNDVNDYVNGNNNSLTSGLTGKNGLYGSYSSSTSESLQSTSSEQVLSKSYSNFVVDVIKRQGVKQSKINVKDELFVNAYCNAGAYIYGDVEGQCMLDETTTYYKDYIYRSNSTVRTFDQNSFEMYLGTSTINKNTILPRNFKVYLPFNYATITENSTTYLNETNFQNYGEDYYLSNSNNQTYVSKLYRTYGNSQYKTYAETNKITIAEGATLDCSNAKLIVGGLMLPSKEGFNSIKNVGNHAAIYNSGKIILGSQGLECYGYIYGDGVIERASNVSQTTVKERSAMLDYTNDADVLGRFLSEKCGGKWPRGSSASDVLQFVKNIFNGVVKDDADFQKAYVYKDSLLGGTEVYEGITGAIAVGKSADQAFDFLKDHDYLETDKAYSMPMIMKYDASAIQCKLKLNSNDKYVQKYFIYVNKIGQAYDFDYNLFGQTYGFVSDKGSESNISAKLNSAIFNIQSGSVYKYVSGNGKMVFETSNARVVNNDNFTYWAYFDSNDHYSVSGSFTPVALYNTQFKFTGTSSLAVNCSDIWVLPSAEMQFTNKAKLSVGSTNNVKGYVDIWSSPYYQKTYTAHGNIATFNSNDLYQQINVSRYSDKPLLSYSNLSNGQITYTSSVAPDISSDSVVAGNIYTANRLVATFITNQVYNFTNSYMTGFGEGKRDLGSDDFIYQIRQNVIGVY